METEKREKIKNIIRRKLLPIVISITGSVPVDFEAAVAACTKIFTGVKDQYIEESGDAQDGYLIYFESGIARCYYYDTAADKYIITRITRKDDVVIDLNAYLHETPRVENVQMLETGTLLTIPYFNLKALLEKFPEVFPVIIHLQAEREKQHLAYQGILRLAADDKVKTFLDSNPGIATRVNNEIIASHLDMCRSTFSASYAKYRAARNKEQ